MLMFFADERELTVTIRTLGLAQVTVVPTAAVIHVLAQRGKKRAKA